MKKLIYSIVLLPLIIQANFAFDCSIAAGSDLKSKLSSSVAGITPLGHWANVNNLCIDASDNMFMLKLDNGVNAVFKAYDNMAFANAEVAAFNASNWLGLDVVPYTEIKQFVDVEGVQKSGSIQPWVQHVYSEKPTSLDDLKSKIGEDNFANMQIFYFLMGQYNRRFGNQVVYTCNGKVKVALVDNGSIMAKQLVKGYGQLPWVAMAKAKDLIEEQPATLWESLETKQNPKDIFKQFSNFDFYTNRDIKDGYAHIWNGYLWRQFYGSSTNLGPAFSERIKSKLLAKLKKLNAETVKSFWPEFPEAWSEERINEWVNGILERRDMIVKYFEQHPEDIVN